MEERRRHLHGRPAAGARRLPHQVDALRGGAVLLLLLVVVVVVVLMLVFLIFRI